MKNINYVLGFMFDEELKRIALIHKNKPEWQKGKLNGIGGKVEKGELPSHSMVREFLEETGFRSFIDTWKAFCNLLGNNNGSTFIVYCYYNVGNIDNLKSTTDEIVTIVNIKDIDELNIIDNVRWLIPLALDFIKHPNNCPNIVFAHY